MCFWCLSYNYYHMPFLVIALYILSSRILNQILYLNQFNVILMSLNIWSHMFPAFCMFLLRSSYLSSLNTIQETLYICFYSKFGYCLLFFFWDRFFSIVDSICHALLSVKFNSLMRLNLSEQTFLIFYVILCVISFFILNIIAMMSSLPSLLSLWWKKVLEELERCIVMLIYVAILLGKSLL